MQESSDEEEQDELAPSDNSSEDESDEETSKRKKKTVSKKRKNVPSSIAFDSSSQLLEQVDEATLSTQNSLYGIPLSLLQVNLYNTITHDTCLIM